MRLRVHPRISERAGVARAAWRRARGARARVLAARVGARRRVQRLDRRENPRDDLASLLANATLENGEPMGLVETLGYYLIVFNAGHDTPRHSLSGAMAAFLDHPEEFARLKADPSLIKMAVEEIVRWTAPVNYMKRTALRDYQLDDTLIREGEALPVRRAARAAGSSSRRRPSPRASPRAPAPRRASR